MWKDPQAAQTDIRDITQKSLKFLWWALPLASFVFETEMAQHLHLRAWLSAALWSCVPKSPEDLSWIPVSSFTVCSKWNLCLPLPHLLLLPSPLLLFMVPLWLKIIAMPSVLSFPLLPRYDGLLLFLPCLINQLTSSVPSLCLCPS